MIANRLVALKACALLLPSPFATMDPDGEDARAAEIAGWLGKAGVDVAGADREHIKECAEEAQDALVPINAIPPVKDMPRLRHPLSAKELLERARVRNATELRKELLDGLPPPNGAPDHRWYCLLWRALMQHAIYSETPADARMPDHTVAAHRSLTAALAGATFDGDRPALLALHVGPVQSFIAAARRTHDLSLGSYTAGFLAFAGARALAEALGPDVLVNPDVSCRPLADRLLFGDTITEKDRPKLLRAALMNKVLAVVPDRQAEELARDAMKAVSETWTAMAEQTKAHIERHIKECRDWSQDFLKQVDAHLEIDAVVQRWPSTNVDIKKLREDAGLDPPKWIDRVAGDHPGAACGDLMDLTERILAAHRKSVEPQALEGDRRPKCTVCGLREQMGPIAVNPAHQQGETRAFFESLSESIQQQGGDEHDPQPSIQLVHGEGLCAVCLTKRFAPEVYYGAKAGKLDLEWKKKQDDRPLFRFPSTATIASAPLRFYLLREGVRDQRVNKWLDLLDELHRPDALEFTPPRNLLRGLGLIGNNSRLLSHDGTWLYESAYDPDVAWRSHFAREPVSNKDQERWENIVQGIRKARPAFRRLQGAVGGKSASAYYAVIVLDGDKMGEWKTGRHPHSPTIGELAPGVTGALASEKRPLHPALQGELSRRVATLGIDLHAIVDRHLGRVVYYGGDDLLALLPLATALPCLEEIRGSFQSIEHLGDRVTISAGVAVSHWREPLSRALAAARDAETGAKKAGRNRFAIHADKRSGETHEIVLPWSAAGLPVIPTIIDMLNDSGEDGLASAKAAYQLREELPAVGFLELRDAFRARVDKLVFSDRAKTTDARTLLRALLKESDAKITSELTAKKAADMAMDNAKAIVDLLLFVRFLMHEEHGIVTKELRDDLPKKEEML